ncbi:hypothetical protein [Uliginosibacterium sediminicola]|uniref:Type II secretion system protein GspC N-terminal domain-containing protein n=1 Tax=Uliginosibacterium sediminicola TaxID=2024550 RepID=A0ABU9Z0H1_9RHOO
MNERTRMLLLLPVLGIAAWLALFGDKSHPGSEEVALFRGGSAQSTAPRSEAAPLSARESLSKALAETEPNNLFPVVAPAGGATAEQAPPPEAEAPPPTFVVIGRMLRDGHWNVFLDRDNQTYVATAGAEISGFKVLAIEPKQVLLRDLSTQSNLIIPIEGEQ